MDPQWWLLKKFYVRLILKKPTIFLFWANLSAVEPLAPVQVSGLNIYCIIPFFNLKNNKNRCPGGKALYFKTIPLARAPLGMQERFFGSGLKAVKRPKIVSKYTLLTIKIVFWLL